MEYITGDYKTLIEKCVSFAAQFICIPQTELLFDDCPSNRFPTMSNAAESCVYSIKGKDGYYLHGRVIFNRPWFEKSWNDHKTDLEFYIFHELRHIHQQASITLKNQNQPTNEPYEEISKWENEFNNYKCNDGSAEAREENMAQEVELDANGYGLSLLNLYHIRDVAFSFEYSLPEEAYRLADERSRQYYKTKPELRTYLQKLGARI
ncbi:hypothetical protein F110043I8_16610 [Ruminococcus sp. f11]|nr:hypothetical protein DWX80_18405 [Ruminococcus sp. AF21-3]